VDEGVRRDGFVCLDERAEGVEGEAVLFFVLVYVERGNDGLGQEVYGECKG
jgi:hypothetical protein